MRLIEAKGGDSDDVQPSATVVDWVDRLSEVPAHRLPSETIGDALPEEQEPYTELLKRSLVKLHIHKYVAHMLTQSFVYVPRFSVQRLPPFSPHAHRAARGARPGGLHQKDALGSRQYGSLLLCKSTQRGPKALSELSCRGARRCRGAMPRRGPPWSC